MPNDGESGEKVSHRGIRIDRHGNRWRWRVRFNGQLIQRTYESLDAAVAALDRVLDERERLRQVDAVAAAGNMTVERLVRAWFAEKRFEVAPATAERYRIAIEKHVVPNIGHLDANLITEADLKAYYRTRTWKTAKESHKALAMAFDWALDRELLRVARNPCRRKSAMPSRRMCIDWWEDDDVDAEIRPVDPKTIPLDWQLEAMLAEAATWPDGRRFWLYLVLGSGTGARPGELCAIRRADLDLARNRMAIRRSADRVSRTLKGPKNKWSKRWIPVSPELLELILPHLPEDPEDPLFPSQRWYGKHPDPLLPTWNTMNLRHRFRKVCRRLGFTWIEIVRERDPDTREVTERERECFFTPHSLRHYWTTHRLEEGWSPIQVAKYMGHRDDTLVRMLYGNHLLDDTQQAMAQSAYRALFGDDRLLGREDWPALPEEPGRMSSVLDATLITHANEEDS